MREALFQYSANICQTGEADAECREERKGETHAESRAAKKRAEEPLLGEAALKDALAGFGVQTDTAIGSATAAGAQPAADAAPGLKTVSQILGEIPWLLTQSPRHKSIAVGDLEWIVMPAIVLKQFRLFYKGEQPVGVALWALVDDLAAKRIDAGDKRLTAVNGRAAVTCGSWMWWLRLGEKRKCGSR